MEGIMEQKIKEYVQYHFRLDTREDLDLIKDEITSNLIDRYNDLVQSGLSEEDAYIETVKYLGETHSKEEEETIKPTWSTISLVTASSLAFCSILVSFFSSFIGLLVALSSITIFITASYHLYTTSQYQKQEEFDLDPQRSNLRMIMKFFNLNYLPWSISLAISFTGTLLSFLVLLNGEIFITNYYGNSTGFIVFLLFVWGIIFILLIYLFKILEKRIYKFYKEVTGESVQTFKTNHLNKFFKLPDYINWHLIFTVFYTGYAWIGVRGVAYNDYGVRDTTSVIYYVVKQKPEFIFYLLISLILIWFLCLERFNRVVLRFMFAFTNIVVIILMIGNVSYNYRLIGAAEMFILFAPVAYIMISLIVTIYKKVKKDESSR